MYFARLYQQKHQGSYAETLFVFGITEKETKYKLGQVMFVFHRVQIRIHFTTESFHLRQNAQVYKNVAARDKVSTTTRAEKKVIILMGWAKKISK
jgi:hypothetical protein